MLFLLPHQYPLYSSQHSPQLHLVVPQCPPWCDTHYHWCWACWAWSDTGSGQHLYNLNHISLWVPLFQHEWWGALAWLMTRTLSQWIYKESRNNLTGVKYVGWQVLQWQRLSSRNLARHVGQRMTSICGNTVTGNYTMLDTKDTKDDLSKLYCYTLSTDRIM